MNQDELVDQITQEVLKKLRAEGAPQTGTDPGRVVLTPGDLPKYIDHTLLKPDAPAAAFDTLCDEAIKWNFKAVCVNSSRTAYVAKKLRNSGVLVCAVAGFPLGAMDSRSKAFEARRCIEDGAQEVDMVLNVGFLKCGNLKGVEEDIRAVRRATRNTTVLKVIIETGLLTDDEKVIACQLAKKAEADFVKTCTGFLGGGATPEDIALMRRTVGPEMGVKASGGITSYDQAVALIAAGASRLGTSRSVAIVSGREA